MLEAEFLKKVPKENPQHRYIKKDGILGSEIHVYCGETGQLIQIVFPRELEGKNV